MIYCKNQIVTKMNDWFVANINDWLSISIEYYHLSFKMCLYFEEMAICPHPECIYVDNVRQNFCEDFSKSEAKLP